jgi:RNA polymerase sigma-70 factor (ECF subfamily)
MVSADDVLAAFDAVQQPLLRALHSMLGNREDAEDALQTAFLQCWQARDMWPGVRNLRGWVWRIGLNAGRDLLDYARRRRHKALDEVESTAACSDLCLQGLAEREDRERLKIAVDSLRPEERDVFLLRQNQFLTYQQIAGLQGRPIGTVKTLMNGAVRKLRNKFQGHHSEVGQLQAAI